MSADKSQLSSPPQLWQLTSPASRRRWRCASSLRPVSLCGRGWCESTRWVALVSGDHRGRGVIYYSYYCNFVSLNLFRAARLTTPCICLIYPDDFFLRTRNGRHLSRHSFIDHDSLMIRLPLTRQRENRKVKDDRALGVLFSFSIMKARGSRENASKRRPSQTQYDTHLRTNQRITITRTAESHEPVNQRHKIFTQSFLRTFRNQQVNKDQQRKTILELKKVASLPYEPAAFSIYTRYNIFINVSSLSPDVILFL
uniref:30 kDa major early protein n=1 Tax=Human cytomegalovirus (strain Eisenhardt) TaxID=10362 RepID=V30K_HCMVE|nr:RecName: Full=30 kDa major early protein [Human herpesvirus 5 strain Eisenhardt]AAA45978.1 30 kd protein [Human betaherpesvirus 5]